MSLPVAEVRRLLGESRRREKAQALFYRTLAAMAIRSGREADAERLNELHADEQHHLSRLTARLLELAGELRDLADVTSPDAPPDAWEDLARRRETDEVAWYEEVLAAPLDPVTREVVEEILASERRHRAELRGKWMSA